MALQNLCLSTIVCNFESYYEAFKASKDPHLNLMLEFLQRVYSFELAEQIFEKEIQGKYTDFLINEYLKILDTRWFDRTPWKSVVAKIAVIGPNLKKIEFSDGSRPWKEIFCHLPNLEVMQCWSSCNNEILSSIAKFCPNIIEIDISGSDEVTEEGFKSLCKKINGEASCPKLKNLHVAYCKVTDAFAVNFIKNLPSLEVFDYENLGRVLYSMHKEDLHQLDKILPYNLKELNLCSYPCLADILKVCLSVCSFVTNLSCVILESQHLDFLSGFSQLERLGLYYDYNNKDFLDINYFLKSNGSKLKSLTMRKCSVSVSTLAESCPALEMLTMLYGVSLDELKGPIPLFHNLGTFRCINMQGSDNPNNLLPVCAILSSSPKLHTIFLNYCNLTAIELKTEILKCCERCCVKIICFDYSRVEKPFVIDILLTCHSLEEFFLLSFVDCGFDSHDKLEILNCAKILHNKPRIYL